MATGEYALASWADIAAEFGYLADEQAKVERLIDIATARMEMEAKHKILARDFTAVIVDGSGRDILILPQYPVNSVASLYIDSSRVFDTATLIAPTEYKIDRDSGMIRLYSGTFPVGYGVINITYNAGYNDEHEYYPAIVDACQVYVDAMKKYHAGGIGKKTETNVDGMSVSYEQNIPWATYAVLEMIKRRGQ
jgi:hypothetical protein